MVRIVSELGEAVLQIEALRRVVDGDDLDCVDAKVAVSSIDASDRVHQQVRAEPLPLHALVDGESAEVCDGDRVLRQTLALLEVTKNFGERASQLKGLVISRDRLVEELFARERRALETLLSASNVEEPEAEAVVEQVMMVRRAEACAPDTTYSPHLVANILRLLHLAATDRSTSPEASASIRRLALDNAPSMCEQRRVVFEAMKKCGYRGNEAL